MTAQKIINSSLLIVRRLIISFIAFIFLLTITSYLLPIAHAQNTTAVSTSSASSLPAEGEARQWRQLPTYIPPTSTLYTDLLVNNLFHTFSCLAIGQSVIGQPCLTYQVTKDAQGAIQSVPVLSSVNLSGGTLGAVSSVIGALYLNPPVKSADYLASVGQGLGIVKEAHAQGVIGSGAAVLNPIIKLWQVSRNISYVIMIIIFMVIGLMIMFRNRINPQTVITAQTALPGLVIGLILITFSYFLAGLISDMAFIGTNVVGYYFSAAQPPTDPPTPPQNLVTDMKDQNVLKIFAPLTKVVSSSKVADALGSIWNDLTDPNTCRDCPWDMDPQKALTTLTAFLVSQLIMPFGGMIGGIGQIIAGVISFGGTAMFPVQIASLALSFIAMVILIYAMFRLLLRLVNNYITIIFLTITAPFQFLAAALPGRQGIATNWILNMLANILAFPAVIAVFYFVAFLLGLNTAVFRTPGVDYKITGSATFPLFGGMDLSFVNLLLAFGALIALPSVPDIINRTIGRLGVAGQLIGQEIGGGIGQGRQYAGQFQSGIGGMAGQAGKLTDEPGYILTPSGFRRAETPEEMRLSGARAGQLTRAAASVRNTFGSIFRRGAQHE